MSDPKETERMNCQARRCLKPGGLGPGGQGKTTAHLHLSVLYGVLSALKVFAFMQHVAP